MHNSFKMTRCFKAETHVGMQSADFRRRFYPDVQDHDWQDWRWQMQNRMRTVNDLERVFGLTDDERTALTCQPDESKKFPLAITPYYASLMNVDDVTDPLRRTHIPATAEFKKSPGEKDDPLGEDSDQIVPGLVHRYPDRVLFLATNHCATFCRYCNRARLVGDTSGAFTYPVKQWEAAIDYIKNTDTIRDVLISGGDPLILSDEKLDYLLGSLRAIEHIDFVRIGTKIPLVLPQRITPALLTVLKKHQPWLSLHTTHPNEFSAEARSALGALADSGVVIGSQTVLLKGINDTPETMQELMRACLKNRVRPYYLFQCDPIVGSAHFRAPVEKGLEIIESLRGHTTGYAVPHYAIDLDGGGKMPLLPNYMTGRDGDDILLRNYKGDAFRYYDGE